MESDMTTATVTFKSVNIKTCVFDLKHVKSVSAIAILYEGKPSGRIIANWSDNPNGSVCTAMVGVWSGPLGEMPKAVGRAGGYGYDKISSAKIAPRFSGCGMTEVRKWFEQFGYELFEII